LIMPKVIAQHCRFGNIRPWIQALDDELKASLGRAGGTP